MNRSALRWMAIGAAAASASALVAHLAIPTKDNLAIAFVDPLYLKSDYNEVASVMAKIATECGAKQYKISSWGVDIDQIVQLDFKENSLKSLNCTIAEAQKRKVKLYITDQPVQIDDPNKPRNL